MRLFSKKRVLFITLFWICGVVLGQEVPPGVGAAAQYRLGVGARALALGQAFTALAQGPECVYWNPGALAESPRSAGGSQVYPFGGLESLLGIEVQFLGLSLPTKPVGFGLGWLNAVVRDIPYTDESGIIGYFNYDSSLFLLGGGIKIDLGEDLLGGFGATLKIYREQMLEGSAMGFGLDLGLKLDFGQWSIAYVSQDFLGTRYRWQGTAGEPEVEVPWVHRLGVAASWLEETLTTSAEVVWEMPALWSFRAGCEWRVKGFLSLRVGMRLEPLPQGWWPVWSAGLGVSWGFFALDAALALRAIPAAESDTPTNVYVFSLAVNF
ncbi:MAG: hypothetical protein QXY39_04480 [Thermofilaceae archaeon]